MRQIESRSAKAWFCSRKLILGILIVASLRGEQVLSWQSHGVALTTCELGNGTWSVPFQGSRADAKQMRGKRSSAGSTAREGAPKGRKESPHFRRLLEGAVTASEAGFGVVTEGVALL